MVWTPEPWQGFLLVTAFGILMLWSSVPALLRRGGHPLPRAQQISSLVSAAIGVAALVWAVAILLRR